MLKGGYLQKNIYTFEVPVFGQYKKMYTLDSALYWKNIAAQLFEKLEEKKW